MREACRGAPVSRPALALVLLCSLAFLPGALYRVPFDVDEVRYVEVAREIRGTGDWLVMHLNGEVYAEKPPLFFWLTAGLGRLLGEVRAGQLLAACSIAATAAVALRLGRLLSDGDERVAWLGAAAVATTSATVDRGHSAVIDTLLLPLVTGSTLALLEAARAEGRRALGWSAAAAALMTAACLTKGPVGVLFPLLGALVVGLMTRGRAGLRLSALFVAPALAGGLTLLWVHAASRVVGDAFWERMLGQIAKRTGESTPHHPEPPWFYLFDVPPKLLPWALFLPGGWILSRLWPSAGWSRAVRVGVVWAAIGLGSFSLVGGKRPGYVLPLYVPLVIACAAGIVGAEAEQGSAWRRSVTVVLRAVPILLALLSPLLLLAPAGAALALVVAPGSATATAIGLAPFAAWPILPGLGLFGLGLARDAWRAVRDERWTRVAAALAGGAAIGGCLLGLVVVPLQEPRQSGRVLAEQVQARVAPGDRLVLLCGHHDGRLHLWTGVPHYDVVQPVELASELARPGRLWVLGREAPFFGEVPAATQARLVREVEWPGGGRNDFGLWAER